MSQSPQYDIFVHLDAGSQGPEVCAHSQRAAP